jgi:predicted nucleic-acid-binding Zn-ribbon protein
MKILILLFISLFSLQLLASDDFAVRTTAVEYLIEQSDGHFNMEENYHPFIEESVVLTSDELKYYSEVKSPDFKKNSYVLITIDDCEYTEAIVRVSKKTAKANNLYLIGSEE